MGHPRFTLGQVVKHIKFGYRGVVVDFDDKFTGTEEWYERVARSRPPKDQPWYRVLVNDAEHQTYVAERHLESDESSKPIVHPELEDHFDGMRDGYYYRDAVN